MAFEFLTNKNYVSEISSSLIHPFLMYFYVCFIKYIFRARPHTYMYKHTYTYKNKHTSIERICSKKFIDLCSSRNVMAEIVFWEHRSFHFPDDFYKNSVLNLLFMPIDLNVNPLHFCIAFPLVWRLTIYPKSRRPMWNPGSIIC